jgi:hypothetical protein
MPMPPISDNREGRCSILPPGASDGNRFRRSPFFHSRTVASRLRSLRLLQRLDAGGAKSSTLVTVVPKP